jgi:hypothetical protein
VQSLQYIKKLITCDSFRDNIKKKAIYQNFHRMTSITLELPLELEQKLRESISRGDVDNTRFLLADAFAPTVEAFLEEKRIESSHKILDDEEDSEASLDNLLDELTLSAGSKF